MAEISNEKLDEIAVKINKLLLLSKSPNEHEAALALQRAQELLEKYNLDMVTVEKKTGKDGAREDRKLAGGLYKWQRTVWEHTAQLNFCKYWAIKGLTKGAKYEHRLLGRKTNVLSTELMASYLVETIERIARDEYANDPRHYFSKLAIAFREGMADRIAGRLTERRWQMQEEAKKQKETTDSTALTILDVESSEEDANQDFMNGWEPGTAARKRAERKRQSDEWMAEYEKKRAEEEALDEAFKRDHPEEWAKQQAKKASDQAKADAKWQRAWGRRKIEQKPNSYYSGYDRGGSVSLDRQVSEKKQGRLS